MKINKIYRGQILRVVVGITLFAMLSLGNAGAQTTVSSCTNISSPGEYILDRSITGSTLSNCININSSDVIFDGAGFTLDSMNHSGIIGINAINPATVLTNVTVKNLNIRGWYTGIAYRGESNGSITGNTVSNNSFGIVLVNSSSNNTLNSNNISNNSVGTLIVSSSSNNTLSGNNASNNLDGIILNISSNNTLRGNNVANNFVGISLVNSSNNTLSGNTASKNFGSVYMESSSLNNLSGNNASGNLNGIILNISSNNVLSGNDVSNNLNGIFLFNFSNNNTLSSNNISENSVGIYLINSSNNTIYNNFLNNTDNSIISDTVYNNSWNTTRTNGTNIAGGPLLGGNLWASPNGTGFSQTCADADKDGICDSPYVLSSGNVDYLPLVGRP